MTTGRTDVGQLWVWDTLRHVCIALEQLPLRCRTAFEMVRVRSMSRRLTCMSSCVMQRNIALNASMRVIVA
jgi:hypothetical protein